MERWEYWLWPWVEISRHAARAPPYERDVDWTTPNRVVIDLEAMRLRDFSCPGSADHHRPTLIVTPLALHDAHIADLAPNHSLVETLLNNRRRRLFLIEWKTTTQATKLRNIDCHLADLNVAIDEIGCPVDLIGLCQGGWLSLVYAARFPHKVRRLVLVGAPIDTMAEASSLSLRVRMTPKAMIEAVISRGEGLVLGADMEALWPIVSDNVSFAAQSLQIHDQESPDFRAACASFADWRGRLLDLPGPYYTQVIDWLFRENRIVNGTFTALGRDIDLRAVRHPMFLLAGAQDAIVPQRQLFAAATVTGAAQEMIRLSVAPCGHLALFMGRQTLTEEWPAIALWLRR